jgi:hypothetical protein
MAKPATRSRRSGIARRTSAVGRLANPGRARGTSNAPDSRTPTARRPVTQRWARFGPTDRKWLAHVPEDGFCVSVFVFVRDPRGAVLLGRPQPHSDWPERGCVPLWRLREVAGHGEWTVPSSHFLMDEAPDQAARRVAADWAGIPGGRPSLIAVTSELLPTGRWSGRGRNRHRRNHWAMCFLYELRTSRRPLRRPGWSELKFWRLADVASASLGRSHGDLLQVYSRRRPRGRACPSMPK